MSVPVSSSGEFAAMPCGKQRATRGDGTSSAMTTCDADGEWFSADRVAGGVARAG